MTIVTRKPVRHPFFKDEWINEFFGPSFRVSNHPTYPSFRPAINVVEHENGWRLDIAAPGLGKEDFHVEVEDRELKIQLEKKEEKVEGEKVVRNEFGSYSLKRNFQLGESVNTEEINAVYENGILRISLPKSEKAQPRRIEIS